MSIQLVSADLAQICSVGGPVISGPTSLDYKSRVPGKKLLAEQWLHPVRFSRCLSFLAASGAGSHNAIATVGDSFINAVSMDRGILFFCFCLAACRLNKKDLYVHGQLESS